MRHSYSSMFEGPYDTVIGYQRQSCCAGGGGGGGGLGLTSRYTRRGS